MSTYHIKAAGDATKDGLTDATAWPISKISTFAFAPGDQVLFKKGDVFACTASIGYSGSTGNIIQFDAYGAGTNPILDAGAAASPVLSITGNFLSFKNLIIQNSTSGNGIVLLNTGTHDIAFYNCYINNGIRGINAFKCGTGGVANISITYNYFTAISDVNDGTGRFKYGGGNHVQLNSCTGSGIEVAYNNCYTSGFTNPFVGDILSVYKCNGTVSSLILVHHNNIRGGGSSTPASPGGGGKAGIVIGDVGGSYQYAHDNIIINGGAAGVLVQGGTNNNLSNNKIYGSQQSYTGIGLGYANYSDLPANSNTIGNNILNWTYHSGSIQNLFIDQAIAVAKSTASGLPGGPTLAFPTGWGTNTANNVADPAANNGLLADPLFNISPSAGPWNSITTALVFNSIPAKVYGNADFDPGATSGNAITYTSSNTAVATIVSGLIHIVGAGTSTITANDGSTTQAQTLTVNKAVITVNIANKSKNYGASNPGLTSSYSGFVNGDTSSVITSSPTLSTTGLSSSPVGTYPITGSGGAAANYSFTFINGTLTINKVSLSITANNATRVFGAANPTFIVSYSGFVNGDTTVATPPAINSFTNNVTPVGTYSIVPSAAADPNYNITYVNGTLTIMKAPLTITADNQSKNYLAPNPNLTVSYSGFLNGDTANSLTTKPSLSTTANSSSVVGTYPIVPSGAVATNYYFIYVNGVLTITSVALTFNPFTPVTYGVPDFNPGAISTAPITYTSSNTAVATIVGNKIHVVGAGSTTITANNGSTALPQTLTVNPANLIILADNHAIFLGDSIPTLTASYMGFVNGDTSASLSTPPTLTTSATSGSPVGLYPIVPSGAVDGNYNISYSDGTLSIIPVGTVHFNCPVAIKP